MKIEAKPGDALLTGGAAEFLGCCNSWIVFLEATGQLKAERTSNGYRIFRRDELERYKAERDASRARAQVAG